MLRKLFITFLALAGLAGLAAGVGWYLLHDEAFLKKQLHGWFLESTGRTMTFGGPLTLRLGRDITLEAHQVSLSNASWGNRPNIAEAGRLLVTADLRSLFSGKPILRNVEIDDCSVDVAENDQGVSNWNLFAAGDTPPPVEKTATGLQEPVIEIDRGRADQCRVTITSPEREKPLRIRVTSLAMDLQKDGDYQGQAAGFVDDHPMALDGKLGPIRALWQGGQFNHDVKLDVGDVVLHSSGTLADTKTLSGANLSMNFSGPDIGTVIQALNLPPFSSGKFDCDLNLNSEGALTEVDIKGDLGDLEAIVVGQLDRLRHPTAGSLKLTVSGPNLGALAKTLGVDHLVPEPFNLSLESSVTNGRSQLKPLIVSTARDRLEVDGTLGAFPEFQQTELDIAIHSDDADRWSGLLKGVSGPIGAVDARIRLTTDSTGITAIDAVVDQAGSHLEISGGMGRYPALGEPDFTFSLTTPDLRKAGSLFRIKHLPAAAVTVGGRIHHADDGLRFERVLADLEGGRFRIDGVLNPADRYRGSKLDIEADLSNAAKFGASVGLSGFPDQPLHLKAVVVPKGKGLTFQVADSRLGDMSINLDGQIKDLDHPALVDSNFDLKLPSLALLDFLLPDTNLPDLPFSATGRLSSTGDLLTLQAGHIRLGGTTADISGQYAPGRQLVGTVVELSATGSDWTEWVSIAGLESLPRDFRLSGTWKKDSQGDHVSGVDFSLGKMNLKLNGRADDLFALQNFMLLAAIDIADISALGPLLGRPLAAQHLKAGASLNGSRDQFDVTQISAQLGNSDLAGDIRVDRRTKLKLSGAVESGRLDLRPYQKQAGEEESAASTAAPGDPLKKVFDETPVFVLRENPLDLDLKIRVGKLDLNNSVLNDIQFGILWEDNVFQLSPFSLSGIQGSAISGEFSVDGRTSTPELDITLRGEDLRLGLTAVEGQDPATFPPVEMNIDLHGLGSTRHELAKSLEGTIRMYWGSGLYANRGMRLLFSDFLTELLTVLNPGAKDSQYSKLECAVLGADINSGIVTVKPFLLHDKTATIVSEGTIDLETEKLDLVFNSMPRKGLGLSAGTLINSLIKVGGTLAAPAVEFDAENAVKTGGAAIATAGISVLAKSFADRFMSSKDPCGDARKRLEEPGAAK
jgi:uncharacterized protein involved in outer membrane biogenesis